VFILFLTMARPLRVQYSGAVYHVLARGNHGQPMFKDDQDRQRFLETVAEACQKTGWRVYAYVLMSNHYHLLLQTPEPNLVEGMKWLQSTYTQRYNGRHRVCGHLFQGRYKALIMDAGEANYVQFVSTYIHLNPVRAGLVPKGRNQLRHYQWSSYPVYLARRCPEWLSRSEVLGSLGLDEPKRRGYEAYLEGRVLEWRNPKRREDLEEQWKALRRGWYLGPEGFWERLEEALGKAAVGRRRESHSGGARDSHDERAAEPLLRKSMKGLGLREADLKVLPLGCPEKVALAWWLRKHTTVSLRWVAGRLIMGHYTRVTQAVSRSEAQARSKVLRNCAGSWNERWNMPKSKQCHNYRTDPMAFRQSGHVLNEQVESRATFEREFRERENFR
jgi:REP element-mobilizing transposase RayT